MPKACSTRRGICTFYFIKMRKKVLIFHPHFTIAGGAGTFVLEVGSRLHDAGYQVVVLCIRQDSKITAGFREKINFIELGGELSSSLKHWLSLPCFLFRAHRIAKALKAEIIFPQVFPANWWGFICALSIRSKSYRPKVIWMCQEPSAFIHSRKWIAAISNPYKRLIAKVLNPFFKLVDLYLAKTADYVFANSKYGATYAADIYGFSAAKLSHVYLAADPDFCLNENSPVFQDRKNQIVTVCRLTKFKNVDFLIALIKQINTDSEVTIRLKIIGKGEEEQSLISMVNRLNLNDYVEFCGAVSKQELIHILSESKAFALASIDEPFGLTIVEALACGTPAIAFDSAGPSELVLDNVCGYLIPAKDSDSFADAAKKLCFNQQIFENFSAQARCRAAEFDWDKTTCTIAEKFDNNF